jgi:hypothetical protein
MEPFRLIFNLKVTISSNMAIQKIQCNYKQNAEFPADFKTVANDPKKSNKNDGNKE